MYAFGIDIGGTTVKLGLFKAERSDGLLLKKWEIPTRKDQGGALILPDIAAELMKELKDRKLSPELVQGIGIGVPGAVINDCTVNKCVNLGWGLVDVASEMNALTRISNIKVGNDANVAALGEMWKGAGQGYEDVVLITLGTGVGGGIVLGGSIIPGAFGAGGEIGHLTMSTEETMPCGCGKKGHLEQYASATGIVHKTQEMLAKTDRPSILREVPYLSAKAVFDAAKSGDEISLEIVDFVGEKLGMALSYISCVIDPKMYVIGGGVSKAGDILLNSVQTHFDEYVFHASSGAKIALAELGNDAGIYGAVKLVL